MPSLSTQQDFRDVQKLPFCYLCGKDFLAGDPRTRDHLPPETAFAACDRKVGPVLWLPAHYACNQGQSNTDQKVGQLIGLRRREIPASRRDKLLRFQLSRQRALSVITNLDVDHAVWRWVRGFHAALYRECFPVTPTFRALTAPFPRAQRQPSGLQIEPMKEPQHRLLISQYCT